MPEGLTLRQRAIKRSFDIVASAAGLVVLSPVIAAAVTAATVDTREWGLFSQTRIGRYGVPFKIYKVRTMRTLHDGTTVTTAHDARITPLGHRLRRWKLDEFPQLWNVLKGDMSLVGPRPDVSGFADQLVGVDRIILTLRPGVTGPASLAFRDEQALLAEQADPEKYNTEELWPAKVIINSRYAGHWQLTDDIRIIIATLSGRSSGGLFTMRFCKTLAPGLR